MIWISSFNFKLLILVALAYRSRAKNGCCVFRTIQFVSSVGFCKDSSLDSSSSNITIFRLLLKHCSLYSKWRGVKLDIVFFLFKLLIPVPRVYRKESIVVFMVLELYNLHFQLALVFARTSRSPAFRWRYDSLLEFKDYQSNLSVTLYVVSILV